jgi:hypothetical protein
MSKRKAKDRTGRTWKAWAIVDRELDGFACICDPSEPRPVPSFPEWNKVVRVRITEILPARRARRPKNV